MILASGFAGALALAAAAQGPWILNCSMPQHGGAADAQAQRVFRIGPRLFQERRPGEKDFGPNLCDLFSCVADRDRMEAAIRSATLDLKIIYDRASGRAEWSTVGASNLSATSGFCTVRPESAAPATGAPPL